MTEILSGVATSLFGNPASYQMPDNAENDWRQHYLPQMSLLPSQWTSSRPSQMGSLQDVDMSMFQPDASGPHYIDSYGGSGSHHHMSPPVGYHADGSWASDVDMNTPSTGPFPPGISDGYHQTHTSGGHLNLPPRDHLSVASLHSPRSSRGALSPNSHTTTATNAERPELNRSNTAPEQRGHRRSTTSGVSVVKRSGSEEAEEEPAPVEEGKGGRGRKRQRVPHTAVERRYRENLNAHLDKLRQTVPAFAKRRASGASKAGDASGEGVRPSKCEILNGAIEHILATDKENAALKNEVSILRARLDELERWYGNTQAGAYPGV